MLPISAGEILPLMNEGWVKGIKLRVDSIDRATDYETDCRIAAFCKSINELQSDLCTTKTGDTVR